jgi:hypothetical protein
MSHDLGHILFYTFFRGHLKVTVLYLRQVQPGPLVHTEVSDSIVAFGKTSGVRLFN